MRSKHFGNFFYFFFYLRIASIDNDINTTIPANITIPKIAFTMIMSLIFVIKQIMVIHTMHQRLDYPLLIQTSRLLLNLRIRFQLLFSYISLINLYKDKQKKNANLIFCKLFLLFLKLFFLQVLLQ